MNQRSPSDEICKHSLRRNLNRSAATYDEAAVLQTEVGKRMLQRLDLIRLMPEVILDAGCATGHFSLALLRHYRKARVLALDPSVTRLRLAGQRKLLLRKPQCLCADLDQLPITEHSCDMVFSNLALHWCSEAEAALGEFHRVLRGGGLVFFSTFGPDTLHELRASWATADQFAHVHTFTDLHDVGDALVRAGFADPVMDVEHFTVTYPGVTELMRDLKRLGAGNVSGAARRTVTGKGRLRTVTESYERHRREGRLPATCEVVYGHAWVPQRRPGMARNRGGGVATIDLGSIPGRT